MRQAFRENLCGTDFLPHLCKKLQTTPGNNALYLLGARPGVAQKVARWITRHYPDVKIAGWQHGYYSCEEEPEVLSRIKSSGANILLVAFGAPRQDVWIHKKLPETGVKLAMGVGGLFDFYSGRIPRAPIWVRELGMEWVYRLAQEPRRMWRRYVLGNGLFLIRVMRQAVTHRSTFLQRDSHSTLSQ